MAKLTSHTLNGMNGTHAGGIKVSLSRLTTSAGDIVFSGEMDQGGRLSKEVDLTRMHPDDLYELIFDTGAYWAMHGIDCSVEQIVLRFKMTDPKGKYHMPIILNPNSYSMWASS